MTALDDDTTTRILDAAAALLAGHDAELSMAEVAARAGVARGTVYRRFATREALLERLAAERGLLAAPVAEPRERILDGVASLVAERGLAATTMEQVAERAGVGVMTVYRHFGDRGGLLAAFAAERSPRRYAAALELGGGAGDMEAELSAFVTRTLGFVVANPELVRMHFAPTGESAELFADMRKGSDSARAMLTRYLERQIGRGRLQPGDPARMTMALMAMIFGFGYLGRDALSATNQATIEDIAHFITRTALHGWARPDAPAQTPADAPDPARVPDKRPRKQPGKRRTS